MKLSALASVTWVLVAGECWAIMPRRGSHWALSVQVLKIFSPVPAEDAGSVRRAPPGQSAHREAPRAHAGREGVVCEKAGVEPELGWEVDWE